MVNRCSHMENLTKKNVEIPETGISVNQQTSVRSNDSVLNHFLLHENDVKESIDKLGVVLEYLVGLLYKDEAAIVEYVKNFAQNDVFLLTYVTDANSCLRDILFSLEDEKGNKTLFPAKN